MRPHSCRATKQVPQIKKPYKIQKENKNQRRSLQSFLKEPLRPVGLTQIYILRQRTSR